MKIHRTFANDTSARITGPCFPIPSKHCPQQNHRRTHFSGKIFRYHGTVRMTAVQIKVMILPPGFRAQLPEDFSIKNTSVIFGHSRSTLVPELKRAAAITGSAVFFDPWIRTVPCSGLPPVTTISSISFKSSTPKRASYFLFYVILPCL